MVTTRKSRNTLAGSAYYPRYVTLLLLAIYIFNQLDRNVFDMLMQPIKQEMSLSDSQLGFLSGPALVIIYTLLGVPVARLADRVNRVILMTVAILAWGAATWFTATAHTYHQLVYARISVGIGEAGFSAVAIALLSDLNKPEKRAGALATFMLAIPISGIIGYLAGGWVNQEFGWRAVYKLAGGPGIFLAVLLVSTVREPREKQKSALHQLGHEGGDFRLVCRMLWGSGALRHLLIGQSLACVVANITSTWMVPYLIRAYGMKTGELGTWFAVISLAGMAGIALSGYHPRMRMFSSLRAQARLIACASVMIAPVVWLALSMPAAKQTLLILIPAQIMLMYFLTPTQALSQTLSPSGARATIASIFILVQVLVGGIVGGQGVGWLSDAIAPHVANSAAALRDAMMIALLTTFWAAFHFWRASQAMSDQPVLRDVSTGGDDRDRIVATPEPVQL